MTNSHNNGGKTDYWDVPRGATTLNDLIEHKNMTFAQGVIFKAAYRLGDERHHSTVERDLNKIVYYVQRMLAQIDRDKDDDSPSEKRDSVIMPRRN